MKVRSSQLAWLVLLIQPLWANAASTIGFFQKADANSARVVPLDKIDPRFRDAVRQVLEKPLLTGRGPAEAFNGRPEHYSWFLEHPDRAVIAWRRLGAK